MDAAEIQSVLKAAYDAAPEPVRAYVSSGAFKTAMTDMQAKLGLSPEQSSVVSDEALMLLLGMSEPAEFVAALGEGGLSETETSAIVAYINENIFSRLQKEESGTQTAERPAMPQTTQQPAPAPAKLLQRPSSAVSSIPAEPMPASRPAPPPSVYVPQTLQMRTMAHDVESMKAGKSADMFPAPAVTPKPVPGIPNPPAPAAPLPAAPTQAPEIERATRVARSEAAYTPSFEPAVPASRPPVEPVSPPVPVPMTPPASPSMPVSPAYSERPAPVAAPQPFSPTPTKEEVTTGLQQYGIDPYREPIE